MLSKSKSLEKRGVSLHALLKKPEKTPDTVLGTDSLPTRDKVNQVRALNWLCLKINAYTNNALLLSY